MKSQLCSDLPVASCSSSRSLLSFWSSCSGRLRTQGGSVLEAVTLPTYWTFQTCSPSHESDSTCEWAAWSLFIKVATLIVRLDLVIWKWHLNITFYFQHKSNFFVLVVYCGSLHRCSGYLWRKEEHERKGDQWLNDRNTSFNILKKPKTLCYS